MQAGGRNSVQEGLNLSTEFGLMVLFKLLAELTNLRSPQAALTRYAG